MSAFFTRNLKSVFLPQAHLKVDKTAPSKIILGSQRKTNTFSADDLELLLVNKSLPWELYQTLNSSLNGPLYWKVAPCIIVGITLPFFMELCQNEYSFVNVCTLTFSIIWLVLKLNIHSFSRILWLDTALTAEHSCYTIGSTVSHRRDASSCHAYISNGSYTWSANVAPKNAFSSIFLPPIIFWQIAVHTYYTHAETLVCTHARVL